MVEGCVETGLEFEWTDLDAFTQGYVEALAASAGEIVPRWNAMDERTELEPMGFSDLAPEALAQIIADCSAYVRMLQGDYSDDARRTMGGAFWAARNGDGEAFRYTRLDLPALRERAALFSPLTVSLADDGKVHLREAA